jgi:hypothetical protein
MNWVKEITDLYKKISGKSNIIWPYQNVVIFVYLNRCIRHVLLLRAYMAIRSTTVRNLVHDHRCLIFRTLEVTAAMSTVMV